MTDKKKRKTIEFVFVSIFPRAFASYVSESLFKRAREKNLVSFSFYNPRDYAGGHHRKVDDRPFGGGPGMVMMVAPLYAAVESIKRRAAKKRTRIILFSTRGKKFAAADARRLCRYDRLVLICGRYEGVDERVARHIADEELSIGDYVLSGGELPALVVAEAVARHIPGFLGKAESLEEVKGSHPAYTRPAVFSPSRGAAWKVPKVLVSGNHAQVAAWRTRWQRQT